MSDTYDIIIVGGGVHGVGVAQAAAAKGFQAALLEQQALGHGTSSRSSKLIHGGLRYLESGSLGLARELLREREMLLKNAPDLVTLQPFYLPVYKHSKRPPWMMRLGLSLYAALGNLRPHARFRTVPKKEWDSLDGLRQEGLRAVFQYWDGQTDDAELTKAVMASAQGLGAELLCPARFVAAKAEKGRVAVTCELDNEPRTLYCRTLVNAAGPWINNVLSLVTPAITPFKIDLVQGTHIIIEGAKLHGFYYVESKEDRRGVFVMPWYDKVLVGSTETLFTGSPEDVQPLPQELRYLQQAVQDYFPGMESTILESFAGLRVLPAGSNSLFRRTRETHLHIDKCCPNVLSIYGGKLTGYRATAEKVLAKLKPLLPARKAIADTTHLPLKRVS